MTEKKSLTWGVRLSVALFVLDIGFAALTLVRLQPPAPSPLSTPLGGFSAERAMRHVRALSQEPRPIGSAAHARARSYIIRELESLGLHPETQKSLATVDVPGFGWISSGAVENVFVRIPGSQPSAAGPLLIAAHYDSVRNSKGASDDAAGVATLLETARALRAPGQPAPKQDLLLLFSDGEENALLGAQAFLAEAPAARKIGMALNFEARGSGGPSAMYETGPLQGPLIQEFAQAQVPRAVTNSFVPAVARFLPNDTDFSVFRSHGISGLSFAYAGRVEHYHSYIDDEKHIDQGSLQQHGDYALQLAKRLGGLEQLPAPGPDRVYFDLFGSKILSYPVAWLPWLGTLCLLLLYFHAHKLGARAATARSVGALYLAGITALAAVTLLAFIAGKVKPSLLILHSSAPIAIGYLLLAVGVFLAVLSRFKRFGPQGKLSAWLALLLIIPILEVEMPGATYVLELPLLAAMCIPGFTAVGAVILSYAAYVFYIAVGAAIPAAICLPVLAYVLVSWPRIEGAWRHEKTRERRFWQGLITAGLVTIGITLAFSHYDSDFPEPSFVAYAVDFDQAGAPAFWVTDPERDHKWLAQFREKAKTVVAKDAPWYSPSASNDPILFAPAPRLALNPPELQVLESRPADSTGFRHVRFKLRSRRGARCLLFWEEEGRAIRLVTVGGKAVHQYLRISPKVDKWLGSFFRTKTSSDWTLSFCAAPPEGIEIEIETPSPDPLRVRFQDKSEGLPGTPAPRPAELMPSSGSDVVVLSRSARI